MARKGRWARWVALATAVAVLVACTQGTEDGEESGGGTASSETSTTEPGSDTPPTAPEHRIGVRVAADGNGEFYDRTTGETWVPRGFNHWRWDSHDGYLMDRTFRAGDNDLEEAKADLAAMGALGYNAVRIWVAACFGGAPGCLSDDAGNLRTEYIDNVAEYLRAAKEHGIAVMFTVDDMTGARYTRGIGRLCCEEWNGFNLFDLTPGGVADQVRFWEDLVGGLVEVGAPLDAVWAYQLRNEHFFEANQPPFGVLDEATTANGETYDLTDPAEVEAMLFEGRSYWARTLASRIKEIDPTALVTVGFFASAQGPTELGRGDDPRLVDPRGVAAVDEIDFLDFHHYPGLSPVGWEGVWANSLMVDSLGKPIVLGEVGASRDAYTSVDAAIVAYTATIASACQEGLDGYLGWVWDGLGFYSDTWNALDSEGAIARALSPAELPDPCDPPLLSGGNLALDRPVTASMFEDTAEFTAPPRNAVDGSEATWWTAPESGPQWIEVDLEVPARIESIRMITEHGSDTALAVDIELLDDARRVVGTLRLTSPGPVPRLVLEEALPTPVDGVRFVRATTHREGWIIWHELEVHGTR